MLDIFDIREWTGKCILLTVESYEKIIPIVQNG